VNCIGESQIGPPVGDSARIKSFPHFVNSRGERPPQGILRRASSRSNSNCTLFTGYGFLGGGFLFASSTSGLLTSAGLSSFAIVSSLV